jgi:hypothetical protein
MTWKEYAFVATLAMLGIALIAVSYWLGFRRRAGRYALPNGGPARRPDNLEVGGGPASVS